MIAMLSLSSTKVLVRRCVLVWLFIASLRVLLRLLTDHTLDNLFAAYLGEQPGTPVRYEPWFRPGYEYFSTGWYILGSKFIANLAAAATGLILWVFLASLTYGVLSHRRHADAPSEMRCRRCGRVLRGLAEPVCPSCGEAI
jgi:hypothetical protein